MRRHRYEATAFVILQNGLVQMLVCLVQPQKDDHIRVQLIHYQALHDK